MAWKQATAATARRYSASNHTRSDISFLYPHDAMLARVLDITLCPCLCPCLSVTVLGSQPAGDVSHKPGGRLPLLSTKPSVTLATLKRAAINFAAW